jgi:phosphate transport system substrate-binding protein
MKFSFRSTLAIMVIAMLLVAACGSAPTATPTATPTKAGAAAPNTAGAPASTVTGSVKVAGSTTVQPLAEKLGPAFTAKNPGVKIEVSGGGTGVGVKSAGEGTVDVGMASRDITDDEKKLYPDMKTFVIGKDGIAVIVNPGVGVDNLTKEQARDIFMGKISNWKDVGGPDKPIVVVSREEGSGTRTAFQELVMGTNNLITDKAILQNSNGAIRTTVASTPNSTGYLSLGALDKSVKALKINGVDATEDNAATGKYPVVRPLLMLTKGDPKGAAKAWLDWIMTADGQAMVKSEGYIPVK